ncbi:MAG TPA: hypothetical protein VE978_02155 [Chitinophagales bacterium]|nr:hypothetical protein [Chitinophagales bacterium]
MIHILKNSSPFFLLAYFISCTNYSRSNDHVYVLDIDGKRVKVYLERKSDSLNIIHADSYSDKNLILSDKWKLNFPAYHFECADINGDSQEDILVGVIKPTRFDSVVRKRIFIFKLVEGYIRPLWLGSRVGQPLEDFRIVHHDGENFVRTVEWEENRNFLVAEYRWKSFGLEFVNYLDRNISKEQALKILNSTP